MAQKIRVRHMITEGNNPAVNHFIIDTDEGVYFQSYNSIIAFVPIGDNKTQLDKVYWNYSRTTGKYRNQFLGESFQDTRRKIDMGIYELVDLQ